MFGGAAAERALVGEADVDRAEPAADRGAGKQRIALLAHRDDVEVGRRRRTCEVGVERGPRVAERMPPGEARFRNDAAELARPLDAAGQPAVLLAAAVDRKLAAGGAAFGEPVQLRVGVIRAGERRDEVGRGELEAIAAVEAEGPLRDVGVAGARPRAGAEVEVAVSLSVELAVGAERLHEERARIPDA